MKCQYCGQAIRGHEPGQTVRNGVTAHTLCHVLAETLGEQLKLEVVKVGAKNER